MKCKSCGKEFSVETKGREFVFCPYCGDKHFLLSDKYKSLKELLYAARKNPEKHWELAKRLYDTIKINHTYTGTQRELAKKLGMSQASLHSYIKAYEFAKSENIDQSRIEYTKVARLAGCKNFDLAKDVLKDFYRKDIYTATQDEIKKVVADVNSTEKNLFF